MSSTLPQLQTLLTSYRAEALRTMRDANGLPASVRLKDEIIQRLTVTFARADHVKAALAAIDPTARALLNRVQHAGGSVNWETLGAILRSEGIVGPARTTRRYRSGPEEIDVGNPSLSGSTAFQDVLARLELRGLLLGETPQGGSTVVDFGTALTLWIPREVWPHLPAPAPLAPPPPPTFDRERSGDPSLFSRELYIFWSYIWQNEPTLLKSSETVGKRDLKVLVGQLPHPYDLADVRREDDLPRLYFQRLMLQGLDLVERDDSTLRADPDSARERWARPLAARAAEWLVAWREATWWNELNHLPGISWRPNSSYERVVAPEAVRAARRAILARVGQEGVQGEWTSFDVLSATLRLSDRDLLLSRQSARSSYGWGYYGMANHRYTSYTNSAGWSFEPVTSEEQGWARVEEGVMRRVLEALHWMGLVDLGFDKKGGITAFRLTPMGRHLLAGAEPPAEAAPEGARVVVQPNFHIVAFGPVSEGTLMELEHFADRLSTDRAIEFELTRSSLYRAQSSGQGAEAVIARLAELTGAEVPQNVARTLREWQAIHERIVVHRRARLLQVADPALLESLQQAAGDALRPLSATMALVTDAGVLRHALQQSEISPVRTHDRRGAGGLLLDEEGAVSFRHKVPHIYLVGQVQQLAEWEEAAGRWRLTPASVRKARDDYGMDAAVQLEAWHTLLATAPPPWLGQRIKAWASYYGGATLHRPVLIELRDEKALAELREHPEIARRLKRFKPRGPLVTIKADSIDEIRALLAHYGIEITEK